MRTADEPGALLQSALDCYLAAIMSIAECLAGACPDIGSQHREQLVSLRQRLAFEPNVATLEESRETLEVELSRFAERAREYIDVRSEHLKEVLMIVNDTTDSLVARTHGYSGQFRELAEHLRNASELSDLAEIREKLKERLVSMRDFLETADENEEGVFARMQKEILEFKGRLSAAEAQASRDPLTGLANRLELDRQMHSRISVEKEFSLVFFDLDDFKLINDRFGHLCGDEVLKQMAARLRPQVRTRDVVSRWGGDEFLILLECGLPQATARCQQITQWISGPYRITVNGDEKRVDISVSSGVAAWTPGESAEELIRRADELLYEQKSRLGSRSL